MLLVQPRDLFRARSKGRVRCEELPDVPTFEEAQLGVPLYSWNGIFARAGTSPEITSRLSSALQNITSGDDFRKKVKEFLQIPRGGTPEEFTAFLKQDSDDWGRIVAKPAFKSNEVALFRFEGRSLRRRSPWLLRRGDPAPICEDPTWRFLRSSTCRC